MTTKVYKPSPKLAKRVNQPNTALLELILFYLTFILALQLKKFRTGIYCDRKIKRGIGDFAVPLAVFIVTVIDTVLFQDTQTRHLEMKTSFGLTRPENRSWIVNPMGTEGSPMPTWMIPASVIPAVLVTILMYLEVEIVENLLSKKERCLKKPSGFHWDLILMGALTFACPVFGLQWVCPAAVQSIAHAQSLTVMKKTAPGEAPQIDYVLEQRVTTILIALLHGLAACCGIFLVYIPSSALFGLFLFLGVIGMMQLQLWHRILLFFVPSKYFPKQPYCMDVRTKRLHLFTFLQLVSFIGLYSVNIFGTTALAFPFVLIIIALIRIFIFPRIFTEEELIALDGVPQEKLEQADVDGDVKSDDGK